MEMVRHFGAWVAYQRALAGLGVREFAKRVGCDPKTITNIERSATPDDIGAVKIVGIAKALGFPEIQVMTAWKREPVPPVRIEHRQNPPESYNNIEPYTEQKIPVDIPQFELDVAAGGWVEAQGQEEEIDQRQIDQGLFRIRIRGDSMEPKYPNGSVVEFKVLRQTGDERSDVMEIGKNYCVYRSDGSATFKKLAAIEDEMLTFRAINPKYKKPLTVARTDVVRMAVAMGRFEPD